MNSWSNSNIRIWTGYFDRRWVKRTDSIRGIWTVHKSTVYEQEQTYAITWAYKQEVKTQEHEYLNRQFSLWYLNIRYETVWILFGTILVHFGDGHLNDSRSMIADWQSNRSYWKLRNWTVISNQIGHRNSHYSKSLANEQYYFNSRGNGTETEIIFFDYGMWIVLSISW